MLSSVDIAPGCANQIALDQDSGRPYCACGDAAMISVVQMSEAAVTLLGNVPSYIRAHKLAVAPKTHAIWISYSDKADGYLQQSILPSSSGGQVKP